MDYLAISQSFTRKNYRFIFKEMSNLRYFMYLLGLLKILPFVAINIADFEPGAFADHTVRRQAELLLEFFHNVLGHLVKHAVHGRLAEERVVLGNAGKLPLDDAHVGAGAAAPQRAARVAGRDGCDVIGGDQLHPAAVVVPQNLQGVFAFFGAVDGAPLLHARASDSLAVAILGVVGLLVAAAAHVGVEKFGGQFFHHRKHRAARDIGLVDARRAGDIKTIAPAGIPLGPDAVKRKADLRKDVRAQCLFRPGRADSRGCLCRYSVFLADDRAFRQNDLDQGLIQHQGAVPRVQDDTLDLGHGQGGLEQLADVRHKGGLHLFGPLHLFLKAGKGVPPGAAVRGLHGFQAHLGGGARLYGHHELAVFPDAAADGRQRVGQQLRRGALLQCGNGLLDGLVAL